MITGGAGFLGDHFCGALLEAGARVVSIDRVAGMRSAVEYMIADISEESEVIQVTERICDDIGVPHVLVNNAASKSTRVRSFYLPFEHSTLEMWNEVVAVNLSGAYLVTREIGRRMRENGSRGSIINLGSIYGVLGPDQRIYIGSDHQSVGGEINVPAVYSATKAGIIGLTVYLAAYWGRYGIRVNAISPGGIFDEQNDTFVSLYSARVPLGRMGEPKELATALLFLASDASSYVTGQNLLIDGGLSAW